MTKRRALPVITPADCEGCGACCRHVGHPMFYAVINWETGRYPAGDDYRPPDPLFVALPVRLKHELVAYARRCLRDGEGDDYGEPCIWLTPDGTCRHYEHRPQVCRDFEMGGEDCLRFRREQGIGPGTPPLFKEPTR